MKQSLVLIFTLALTYVILVTDAHYCVNNSDCISFCHLDTHNAICDVPSGECHCHEHPEFSCSSDDTCRDPQACGNPTACCNNDHHCHCHEPCD